ncbi:MAG: hypothetical protein V4557_12675 [Bacteroidota bacterium]
MKKSLLKPRHGNFYFSLILTLLGAGATITLYLFASQEKYLVAIIISLYITLIGLSGFLGDNTISNRVSFVIYFPLSLIVAIGPLVHAFYAALYAFAGSIALGVIISKVIYHSQIFGLIQPATYYYLLITISAINITLLNDIIIKWVHARRKDKPETAFSQELSMRIASRKVGRLLIFVCYFVLIIVFTFAKLNQRHLDLQPDIDYAILQSFATFIALDRILSTLKTMKEKK